MKTKCLTIFVFALATNHAQADGLNMRTHLPPAVQAKTSSLLAKAYAQDTTSSNETLVTTSPSSNGAQNIEIGSSHSRGNAPREQNTVINGPVTIINKGRH